MDLHSDLQRLCEQTVFDELVVFVSQVTTHLHNKIHGKFLMKLNRDLQQCQETKQLPQLNTTSVTNIDPTSDISTLDSPNKTPESDSSHLPDQDIGQIEGIDDTEPTDKENCKKKNQSTTSSNDTDNA